MINISEEALHGAYEMRTDKDLGCANYNIPVYFGDSKEYDHCLFIYVDEIHNERWFVVEYNAIVNGACEPIADYNATIGCNVGYEKFVELVFTYVNDVCN